jgi:hypothetical protein
VLGVPRDEQETARYLGLHYQSNGKWDVQLQLATSKARSALGRCKIIMKTIGTGNMLLALSFFESIVASVYRFGLGVWGVSVAKVLTLDRLFTDYICWLFRFPRTTGVNAVLTNFGRRCAKCDSLFLASIQVASACSTMNPTWSSTVQDLLAGALQSPWFSIVRSEVAKRGMTQEVFARGADFVANRKQHGIHFSQFCFRYHLNTPTGRSSDRFRRSRPFGIFPFLLKVNTHESRFLFSFLCSTWRFIEGKACENYPQYCSVCDQENSGFHVLFECQRLSDVRENFFRSTALLFEYRALEDDRHFVCREVVKVGRSVFNLVRASCVGR